MNKDCNNILIKSLKLRVCVEKILTFIQMYHLENIAQGKCVCTMYLHKIQK